MTSHLTSQRQRGRGRQPTGHSFSNTRRQSAGQRSRARRSDRSTSDVTGDQLTSLGTGRRPDVLPGPTAVRVLPVNGQQPPVQVSAQREGRGALHDVHSRLSPAVRHRGGAVAEGQGPGDTRLRLPAALRGRRGRGDNRYRPPVYRVRHPVRHRGGAVLRAALNSSCMVRGTGEQGGHGSTRCGHVTSMFLDCMVGLSAK